MAVMGREQKNDGLGNLIDPGPNPAQQGRVPRFPAKLARRPEPGKLVEIVADSGKLTPSTQNCRKLVCLEGQKTACLFDQMPNSLGNRQTLCLGDSLEGCPLALGDADVQLHFQTTYLVAIHRSLDAGQRLPRAPKRRGYRRYAFSSREPRLDRGDVSGGETILGHGFITPLLKTYRIMYHTPPFLPTVLTGRFPLLRRGARLAETGQPVRTRYVVRGRRLARQQEPCDLAARPQSRERIRATALKLRCFLLIDEQPPAGSPRSRCVQWNGERIPGKGEGTAWHGGGGLISVADVRRRSELPTELKLSDGAADHRLERTGRIAGMQAVRQPECGTAP